MRTPQTRKLAAGPGIVAQDAVGAADLFWRELESAMGSEAGKP